MLTVIALVLVGLGVAAMRHAYRLVVRNDPGAFWSGLP
jgi:hypothetical protein